MPVTALLLRYARHRLNSYIAFCFDTQNQYSTMADIPALDAANIFADESVATSPQRHNQSSTRREYLRMPRASEY